MHNFLWLHLVSNDLMNSVSAASTDYELYANWLPSGVWQGLFSGYYNEDLGFQGNVGYYWSSTTHDVGYNASSLYFYDDYVSPGDNEAPDGWWVGLAVRCAI